MPPPVLRTLNERLPPPTPQSQLVGVTDRVAGPRVACVTVTFMGLPAAPGMVTVTVPMRTVVSGLSSTSKRINPGLTPLPPSVMCRKSSAVSAVYSSGPPPVLFTLNDRLPAAKPQSQFAGVTESAP